MSMHRRPVGRSRLLAAVGAIVILVGCVLPWWTVGGADGLPVRSGNAFDSLGIVVFVAALATIALVTLPYARERPVAADRWSTYALIAAVAWAAFLYRVIDLGLVGAFGFREPVDVIVRITGLWVTAVGLAILGRAAFNLYQEPARR
jgi:hypothetical protein